MAARKTGMIVGAVAGAGVACAALAGVGFRMAPANADSRPVLMRTSATTPIFAPPPGAPMSFADIFEQVSPAVVSIDVTSRADPRTLAQRIPGLPFGLLPQQPQGENNEEGEGQTQQGQPRLPRQQSSGSGFFISEDGYVVTNNHVIENAEEITVTLKDGKELKATIVGRDEGTDIAVLKVQGKSGEKYPFVSFENAAKPRVGDWVITIGNPFGLGGTATAGIISAYGRDIGENFVDFIQIDAPINRGNSGGPTFDIYGRVIGVNTAIFSPSGGSVGIGFAIPADLVESVSKQLISGGKVTRGYIGATIQAFTAEMAEAQGMGDQRGAIIADLVPGGPAERGGLKPGDVVTAVNGVDIKSNGELTREVAKAKPGENIGLDVIRDGKRTKVNVRSGTRPSESELNASTDGDGSGQGRATPNTPSAGQAVLGMQLVPLDDAARRRFNLDANVRGVAVDSVTANSNAGELGLRRGDVITSVNTRAVTSASEVSSAVDAARKANRTSVLLGVVRQGRALYLPLKITN
ncbi:Do family serine endopeptidase [Caulobacter segnis]|uniref:Do family serine endopeptidase n=1 Tax=Caulobacter segnis TaxID=88688 RepID=UPI002410ADE0|nr:Do family serine endopeptidase [Caulobacter segnis]MDG2523289.1 Do family serine endopeptidase [Caulobacter segnis]